jgi:hypothetical protein
MTSTPLPSHLSNTPETDVDGDSTAHLNSASVGIAFRRKRDKSTGTKKENRAKPGFLVLLT